jgi:hypothetical protein
MIAIGLLLLRALCDWFKPRRRLEVEILSIPSSNQLVNGRLCKPSQEQRKPTGAGGCEVQKPL